LRGLEKACAEWKLVCATANLLKLFRYGWTRKRPEMHWGSRFGFPALMQPANFAEQVQAIRNPQLQREIKPLAENRIPTDS